MTKATKEMLTTAFTLIIVIAFIAVVVMIAGDILTRKVVVIDNSIALYTDTLAATEKGSVKIPIGNLSVSAVEISYKNKGEDVPEEGWHVTVTYKLSDERTLKSSSRINSYPQDADLGKSIFSPRAVCIEKEAGSIYPEVKKC